MSYQERLQNARTAASSHGTTGIQLATTLYQEGYSLRIIQEITDISRSKLQRFFSQNGITRDDEFQTQKRHTSLEHAKRLWRDGSNINEIARILKKNPRTIEAYLRQAGIKEQSNFNF